MFALCGCPTIPLRYGRLLVFLLAPPVFSGENPKKVCKQIIANTDNVRALWWSNDSIERRPLVSFSVSVSRCLGRKSKKGMQTNSWNTGDVRSLWWSNDSMERRSLVSFSVVSSHCLGKKSKKVCKQILANTDDVRARAAVRHAVVQRFGTLLCVSFSLAPLHHPEWYLIQKSPETSPIGSQPPCDRAKSGILWRWARC